MKTRLCFVWVVIIALATGASCRKKDGEPLTYGEAAQALDEASLSTQAAMVVNGTIDISTNFTIGQAVEAAAQELRDFIVSQLPCAEITLEGATLTVEYGVNPGNCTYRGHTYTGTHTVTVARNDDGDVEVAHEWDEISDGRVTVSGTANVTWSLAEGSRHVTHSLTWTRLSDGREGTGSGDRTQTVLEGGIFEGIHIDGWRSWEGEAGTWDLAINDVEIRWLDPVPQSGTYSLSTPFSKDLTMAFNRVDRDTIAVTIKSGDKKFTINVHSIE